MKLNDLTNVTISEGMSQHADTKGEMEKIAVHWKKHGKGMSDDELADAIGNDLEQLEYSPEETGKMISAIISMVKRK